ncbi:cardiac phospholamban [Pungitius pungitius]|uniref:cardiac phospholamban n=1 Tax=Pungitius pungitius TaxID=134920 RepID=UPI002E0D7197
MVKIEVLICRVEGTEWLKETEDESFETQANLLHFGKHLFLSYRGGDDRRGLWFLSRAAEGLNRFGARPPPRSPDPELRVSRRPRLPPPPPPVSMERVQHMTKSAIRRASQIEVTPQAKRNLQELFVNFTLILICLLLIYIIVLLSS